MSGLSPPELWPPLLPGTQPPPQQQKKPPPPPLKQLSYAASVMAGLGCSSPVTNSKPKHKPKSSASHSTRCDYNNGNGNDDDGYDGNDDDDYAACLARRIAHSMLEDDELRSTELEEDDEDGDRNGGRANGGEGEGEGEGEEEEEEAAADRGFDCIDPWSTINVAKIPMSISPQSTLSGISIWCRRSEDTGNGGSTASSESSSVVSSPPSLQKDGWDLLNAAAGHVVSIQKYRDSRGSLQATGSSPHYPAAEEQALFMENSTPGSPHTSRKDWQGKPWPAADNKSSIVNHQVLPKATKHVVACNGWASEGGGARQSSKKVANTYSRPPAWGYGGAWPSLCRGANVAGTTTGSGMRALFLTSQETTGTGVFLPRSYGSPTNTAKRKPSCATVLLPPKVMHALNLRLEDTQLLKVSTWPQLAPPADQEPLLPSPTLPRSYATVVAKGTDTKKDEKQQPTPPSSPLQQITPDISLPTEWTY